MLTLLYCIRKGMDVCLFTTVNLPYYRVSGHGVSHKMIITQAQSLNKVMHIAYLPSSPTIEEYENITTYAMHVMNKNGVREMCCGDIFLEDLRKFREKIAGSANMNTIFPLWGKNTKEVAHEFISLGFKAIVVAVCLNHLDISFLGRSYDDSFIRDLPHGIDPCGENGEFHTFVYDGPLFLYPINIKTGEVVNKTLRHGSTEFQYAYIDIFA